MKAFRLCLVCGSLLLAVGTLSGCATCGQPSGRTDDSAASAQDDMTVWQEVGSYLWFMAQFVAYGVCHGDPAQAWSNPQYEK
jgi:hypothetical protein